jgi:hypothetical protein
MMLRLMAVDPTLLQAERQHLANLLEAVQRCVYFLDASERKLAWPLEPGLLARRKIDPDLFEPLAAVNERFAKLQDTLGAAMRHALLLAGEKSDSFLKVLAFFVKHGVVESTEIWQTCRAARNLAAHDFETDYAAIAEHFNTLHELLPMLYGTSAKLLDYCADSLGIASADSDLRPLFLEICVRRQFASGMIETIKKG